ncbi:phosphoglycerate mutase-like protein [Mycena metata]|uniref:Phosphoglycerate mutase-like protein n=1 Tax=Mycena metata TaxID=1033252 RepID=A0AAD7KFL7_9AGAR|nr:phosphoglycerate mutase-like protein [Mycena metata]
MAKARVTFTFVRHGESTDNLRSVWAGWADATLTNHGMNQAQALAASLAETQFTAIHSSDLQRAHMTAVTIQSKQSGSLPLIPSTLLREQHFGVAEGKPSTRKRDPNILLSDLLDRGFYPSLQGRSEKFPEGESRDDVQNRARKVWADILIPYVREAAKEGTDDIHVAVVSHGIFIKEALRALTKYDRSLDLTVGDYQWLRNTAWTRVVVGFKDPHVVGEPPVSIQPLRVHLTHFNECEHLASVKRQKSGTGREAYDGRQKDIRGFFGTKSNTHKSKRP